MRRDLWALQEGRCLYSDEPVADPGAPRSRTSVDHVLPWSRVRVSALQNLAITSVATNSSKQHLLLAPPLVARWVDHVRTHRDDLAGLAAAHGWPADLAHVRAVAQALYRQASVAAPMWSPHDRVTRLGDDGRRLALRAVRALTEDVPVAGPGDTDGRTAD
jgi:hypothetical protein